MKKILLILFGFIYFPFVLVIALIFGILFGIIGKFVGNTEDLFNDIKRDLVGQQRYPKEHDKKYYEALLKTLSDNPSGKIKGRFELEQKFESGKIKAPILPVQSLAYIILYLFILPFSMVAGILEGPVAMFQNFMEFWDVKILKNQNNNAYQILKKTEKIKINTKKPLVLVVEDQEDQADRIVKIIKETNIFEAKIANNGIEALQILKQHRRFLGFAANKIKCIVLDIKMPQMDGIQFLKQLREKERFTALGRFLPVIMLTAYEDEEKLSVTSNPVVGRAAEYLKKPVNKTELINTLNRVILNSETAYLIDANQEKSLERIRKIQDENWEKAKHASQAGEQQKPNLSQPDF